MSYFDYALAGASFEDVEFPTIDADASEGHTFAKHVAKGRRGTDLEHNQQRPSSGTLTVPLFNDSRMVRRWGPLLPDKLVALRAKFIEKPIGRLFHPTHGSFLAGIETWKTSPDPQKRNGFLLTFEWTEHNGEAAVFLEDRRASDDPSTKLSAAAIAFDALAILSGTAGYRALTAPVSTMLALVGDLAATPSRVASQIESVLADVDVNFELFAAAGEWEEVAALETSRAQLYALRRELLTATERTWTVPHTMTLPEAAAAALGDAARAPLLARANAIPDPLVVAAGTVLVLPEV